MSGGYGQASAIILAEFKGGLFDVLRAVEQLANMFENGITSGSNSGQFFTGAFEYLDVELVFQQFDLVANTGLRSKQFLCS